MDQGGGSSAAAGEIALAERKTAANVATKARFFKVGLQSVVLRWTPSASLCAWSERRRGFAPQQAPYQRRAGFRNKW